MEMSKDFRLDLKSKDDHSIQDTPKVVEGKT
jgi:hypothetical protein